MMMKPYNYIFLRYRHDVLSGEFFNIGLAYYSKQDGFFKFKINPNLERLKKAFGVIDLSFVKNKIKSVEKAFLALDRSGDLLKEETIEKLANQVLAPEDGSFIWSKPLYGVAPDHENMFDDLFSRFIAQYNGNEKSKLARRDDSAIWKPFRDKLVERKLASIFQNKTITSANNRVEFEHAWKNGKWHCIRPLSFDLADSEHMQDKAAKWVGQLYGLKDTKENFKAYFLVGAPTDDKLNNSYQQALNFLRTAPSKPEIVEEGDVDEFIDRIEEQAKSHYALC